MNSCILMAQIISDPELRSTQDNTSVSTMLVEFPSTREGEAPGTLQVQGWGSLAEEIKNTYSTGDNIIIEGRLSMELHEMQGYKEKRAKLVASRIYPMNSSSSIPSNTVLNRQNVPVATPAPSNNTNTSVVDFASTLQSQPTPVPATPPAATSEVATADNNEDWDEIPF